MTCRLNRVYTLIAHAAAYVPEADAFHFSRIPKTCLRRVSFSAHTIVEFRLCFTLTKFQIFFRCSFFLKFPCLRPLSLSLSLSLSLVIAISGCTSQYVKNVMQNSSTGGRWRRVQLHVVVQGGDDWIFNYGKIVLHVFWCYYSAWKITK